MLKGKSSFTQMIYRCHSVFDPLGASYANHICPSPPRNQPPILVTCLEEEFFSCITISQSLLLFIIIIIIIIDFVAKFFWLNDLKYSRILRKCVNAENVNLYYYYFIYSRIYIANKYNANLLLLKN